MIEPARQLELPVGRPVEPLACKRGHFKRLHTKIKHRIEERRLRAVLQARHPVPGSVAAALTRSGTDEENLRREADLLGVTQYYGL